MECYINSNPSNFLSTSLTSGIIITPSIVKAKMYVAVCPRYSSVLSATIIESSEPGRNLNVEKPLSGFNLPISITLMSTKFSSAVNKTLQLSVSSLVST
ncbi:hypothetical protein WN55_07687 [Dufourea novaeangliae]|uniref:Uncharacterized protein n=1 Tax=Dufourea novaeangliae TaxID=178035 RepID=A0A154P5S2_DUFNO|nr:hypothetical protein WN55_07687 [Dufourea novaeangliae]